MNYSQFKLKTEDKSGYVKIEPKLYILNQTFKVNYQEINIYDANIRKE